MNRSKSSGAAVLGAEVALDAPGEVDEVEEDGLAHVAPRGDATRDFHFEIRLEILPQRAGLVRGVKAPAKRINPLRAQGVELFAAQAQQVGFGVFLGLGCVHEACRGNAMSNR